ncbi:PKD domain-containing protein [Nitrospira sp. Kam-Ns4a]
MVTMLGRLAALMVLLALLWAGLFPCEQALAFKIVEPTEGSVLKSGKRVPAKVDLGRDTGVVKVRYYWYADQADVLVEQDVTQAGGGSSSDKIADDKYWQKEYATGGNIVALPFLVSTAQSEPPFGGPLPVPKEAIGKMRLLAIGEISRGRLEARTVFDEVEVQVEPEAELTAIEFETEKPLRLGRTGQLATYGQVDTKGKIFELPVVGVFSDGVSRAISAPSTGTTYTSSNEQVIKVHPQYGLLQLVGDGQTSLTVSNRGKQESLEVIVEVGGEPNEPPIADAGPNRTVKAGTKVKLSGLRSRDPEGEALFYAWSQVRGSKVALLDVNMPEASFLAPSVSEKRLFRFKLRVTDKKGADSLPAFVDVTVEP